MIITMMLGSSMLSFGQQNSNMDIVRGLKPAITEFTSLEQKLVLEVAEKLKNNGFPVDQLTRIHLKKRIHTDQEYYSENEITFFINPGVYKQDEFNWGIETITIDWESRFVVRTPDGGIEFEIGHKIEFADLIMNLYAVKNSYSYDSLLKDHDKVIKEIDEVLIINDLEEITGLPSKGLLELIKNNLIVITANNENENVYEMVIRTMDTKFRNPNSYNRIMEQFRLKIDLSISTIKVLDRFYPNFYPTPAVFPSEGSFPTITPDEPSIKKKE